MPPREALTLVCALIVGISLHATAQGPSAKTEARFVGGFNPDACRYPAEQRRNGISGCCIMDLDIGADGRVLGSEGSCTDAAFLLPTQRCLAAQSFVPATANGRAVRAPHTMEYEWRANVPSEGNLCRRLKTS